MRGTSHQGSAIPFFVPMAEQWGIKEKGEISPKEGKLGQGRAVESAKADRFEAPKLVLLEGSIMGYQVYAIFGGIKNQHDQKFRDRLKPRATSLEFMSWALALESL